ncbi:MAG: SMP-30/gluconolactonase/LRE family protein [Anaerolineales bacterium]|nr:SMP-30/gluconolactonase/LRE family protein [Anaerolineales bacterium]
MPPPLLVIDLQNQLGENPLWHPVEQCLYWEDILGGKIFRYDPRTAATETVYHGETVGGFTFQAQGGLLLFMARGRIALWKDDRLTTLIDEIPAEREGRFNDVIADPQGRVFCGTMPTSTGGGRLYRLDRDLSLHLLLEDVRISNGLGFTPDRTGLYYTESDARTIHYFDYNEASGALTNQRIWRQTSPEAGVPDGLTVAAAGDIWSARWNGGAVYRYSPAGESTQRIRIPAKKVTSVTFGGQRLRDLYITTALHGGDRELEGAGAGALFCIPNAGQGLPEYLSRITTEQIPFPP